MDLEQARAFVQTHHRAVLSTFRAEGTPQMSPVLATTDSMGHITVSTTAGTAKVTNLRRRPEASICVFTEQFFGPWTQIDGEVSIVDLPAALPLLEEYYRSVSGEHENWDEYRDAMRRQNRVLLRLSPTRAVSS